MQWFLVRCFSAPRKSAAREGGRTARILPATFPLNRALGMCVQVWVSPVNAVIPDIGYHIRWWGLWQELIQGVSLENFLHKGIPRWADGFCYFSMSFLFGLYQGLVNRGKGLCVPEC